jgi:hypothetical protein
LIEQQGLSSGVHFLLPVVRAAINFQARFVLAGQDIDLKCGAGLIEGKFFTAIVLLSTGRENFYDKY